jgi:hypothetical protein
MKYFIGRRDVLRTLLKPFGPIEGKIQGIPSNQIWFFYSVVSKKVCLRRKAELRIARVKNP